MFVEPLGASGVNSSAKGMAPKSLIAAYNASSDNSETINEHLLSGMLVTNHSYGVYLYVDGEQIFLIGTLVVI